MQMPRAVPGTDPSMWQSERPVPTFELAGLSDADVRHLMDAVNREIEKFFERSMIPDVFASEFPKEIEIYPQREPYGHSNLSMSVSLSEFVERLQKPFDRCSPMDIACDGILLDVSPEHWQAKGSRTLTLQMQMELSRLALRRCFSPMETLRSDIFAMKVASQVTHYSSGYSEEFLREPDTYRAIGSCGWDAPDLGMTSPNGKNISGLHKLLVLGVLQDISMQSVWGILKVLRARAEQRGSMIRREDIQEAACAELGESSGNNLLQHPLFQPARTGRQCMLVPSKDRQRAVVYPFVVKNIPHAFSTNGMEATITECSIDDDVRGISCWSEIRGKCTHKAPVEKSPLGSIDTKYAKEFLRRMNNSHRHHELVWHFGPSCEFEFTQILEPESDQRQKKRKRR